MGAHLRVVNHFYAVGAAVGGDGDRRERRLYGSTSRGEDVVQRCVHDVGGIPINADTFADATQAFCVVCETSPSLCVAVEDEARREPACLRHVKLIGAAYLVKARGVRGHETALIIIRSLLLYLIQYQSLVISSASGHILYGFAPSDLTTSPFNGMCKPDMLKAEILPATTAYQPGWNTPSLDFKHSLDI